MTYRQYVGSADNRRRYWARSASGWKRVSEARPNPAHLALARMEERGQVTGLITQNVDGLHSAAGSRRVIELHGALASVRCMDCGAQEDRDNLQHRLEALNPAWDFEALEAGPDGDAELSTDREALFSVPACRACTFSSSRAASALHSTCAATMLAA